MFKQCDASVHSVFIVVTCIICKFLFYFLRICFIPRYPYSFRYLVIVCFNFIVYDIIYISIYIHIYIYIKRYTLHKTKHTSSSIFSYRVALDPAAKSYLVGQIKRIRDIFSQIRSNYITHHKKEPIPPMKLQSNILRQLFRLETILELNLHFSLQ